MRAPWSQRASLVRLAQFTLPNDLRAKSTHTHSSCSDYACRSWVTFGNYFNSLILYKQRAVHRVAEVATRRVRRGARLGASRWTTTWWRRWVPSTPSGSSRSTAASGAARPRQYRPLPRRARPPHRLLTTLLGKEIWIDDIHILLPKSALLKWTPDSKA